MVRIYLILSLLLIPFTVLSQPQQWKATDGDTIRMGEERVRITGYDTPETIFYRCLSEKIAGQAATKKLQSLIDTGGDIRLERMGKDRYSRTIARVFVGGKDVAEIMIAEGMAVPYVCPTTKSCPRRINWCDVPASRKGLSDEVEF